VVVNESIADKISKVSKEKDDNSKVITLEPSFILYSIKIIGGKAVSKRLRLHESDDKVNGKIFIADWIYRGKERSGKYCKVRFS